MWKHDKAANSTSEPSTAQSQPGRAASPQVSKQQIEREVVNIGKSVIIKGELSSREDLTIDGRVEGKIELKDHTLTIGSTGKTKANIFAKTVIVMGAINGNIAASEKVDIRAGAAVEGDIVAPRVAIAEGACFRGSIDMQRKSEQQGQGSQQSRVAGLAEPPPVVAPPTGATTHPSPPTTRRRPSSSVRKLSTR